MARVRLTPEILSKYAGTHEFQATSLASPARNLGQLTVQDLQQPEAALRTWMSEAKITGGPIFRSYQQAGRATHGFSGKVI